MIFESPLVNNLDLGVLVMSLPCDVVTPYDITNGQDFKHMTRVASRMRFLRDRALIRLQTRIFLESAVTKLYENA